jgi:hypothetical protein
MIRSSMLFLPAALAAPLLILAGCVQPEETAVNPDADSNPVITSLVAEPDQISVGQSSTITVAATHPQGKPLTFRWGASTGDIIGSGPSVRYTASFCCAGPNYVTVTVLDNAGGSATKNVDILIYY